MIVLIITVFLIIGFYCILHAFLYTLGQLSFNNKSIYNILIFWKTYLKKIAVTYNFSLVCYNSNPQQWEIVKIMQDASKAAQNTNPSILEFY